ncbi:hypothetical protein EG68_03360 [Paragonimus skrjabini miyazakii]|uniref:Tetraspanin n=1 Tax=Paragonimus skrjabini miyazakii TaxID=59628 RepID=A0A8S9YWU8_9TREM|nr:hypothetical protein EG68_03360 [Paragonimus skrjabini miyazakii]
MLCNLPCRIVLIVINSITGLAGLIMLAFGALMVWGQDALYNILVRFLTPLLHSTGTSNNAAQITELIGRVLTATSPVGVALFSLGAALTILSMVGYCGACCNYKILLYVYAALIGVVDLAILLCFSIYFAKRDEIASWAVKLFAESVEKYQSMQTNTVDSLVVGLIQPPLKCCGVDGPGDFKKMASTDVYGGKTYDNLQHPIPCCWMNEQYEIIGQNCPATFTQQNSYINQGCREVLKSTFIHYMNYAAYGLIGAFLVLLVLILFTILTICIDVV